MASAGHLALEESGRTGVDWSRYGTGEGESEGGRKDGHDGLRSAHGWWFRTERLELEPEAV